MPVTGNVQGNVLQPMLPGMQWEQMHLHQICSVEFRSTINFIHQKVEKQKKKNTHIILTN